MNEPIPLQRPRSRKYRAWCAWSFLVLAAIVVGPGRAWHAYHTGPARAFRAGMDAFADKDTDAVVAASEALRGVEEYLPHRSLLEGMVLLRSGRLFEAIQTFGYAKDHPDTAAVAHLLSGEALYRGKRFREAQGLLTKALELDASLVDAHRWLASLYYDIGAMPLARQELEIVAEQAPDDPRPNRLRGLMAKDFEIYVEAIQEYRETLRRGPDPVVEEEVRLELAECLIKVGRQDEAVEVLAPCPPSAQRLAMEAECRYTAGDSVRAKELADEALRLAPDHLDAMLLASTLQFEAGDVASALRSLQAAANRHPKEWRVRFKMAPILERLGRKEEARKEAQAGKELRDLMTRFSNLHQAAIRNPGDAEIRYQLGLAADRLDKRELAHSWFEAALALDAGHEGARRVLEAMDRGQPQR